MTQYPRIFLYSAFVVVSQIASAAVAANSVLDKITDYQLPATVAFNHIYNGYADCQAITQSQVRTLNRITTCNLTDQEDPFTQDGALSILKHTVFNSAEQLFQDKFKCLRDYTAAVQNSPSAMDEYSQKLISLYLNRKKALVILGDCAKISVASPGSAVTTGAKSEEVRLAKISGMEMEFYKVCKNPQAVEALENVVNLTELALPLHTSKSPFDIIENHRDLLKSAKSGQPLTDREIARLDLTADNEQVSVPMHQVGPLTADLKAYFNGKIQEQSLYSKKLAMGYSEKNMRVLFSEGSAEQAMGRMGLSEDESEAEPEIRRMRYCLKNSYEPNLAADAYNFALVYLIMRGAIPGNSKAVLRSRASFAADTSIVIPAAVPTAYKACVRGEGDAKKSEARAQSLPQGFSFENTDLESVKIGSIASCRKPDLRKMFVKVSREKSCLIKVTGVSPETTNAGMKSVRYFRN